MQTKCIVIPTVMVGNQEKDSKLFIELASYTGSRESAKQLWALSRIPEFMENLEGIEYDENGEPTFESFNKAINIRNYLDGKVGPKGEMKDAGAINSKGKPVIYATAQEAYNKVIEFNNTHPNSVASVVTTSRGYQIKVERLDNTNSKVKQEIVFHNSLNNKLLGILKGLGFDVAVHNNPKYDGMFNPTNAETNADNLKTVIQIAKGERGEEAFPEEFSHVIIAGMKNHPLVQRLFSNLNLYSVQDILGENYEAYRDEYAGNLDKLKEEAAGQLLYKHLIQTNELNEYSNLLSRIWNWIKNALSLGSEEKINDAISQANAEAKKLAEMVLDDSVIPLIDPTLVLDATPLFRIGKEANTMKDLADKALETMSRRLKIIRERRRDGKYSKEDVKLIKNLQNLIEKKKYTKSSIQFLEHSVDQINKLYDKIKSLKKLQESKTPTLTNIRVLSHALRDIKTFSNGYADIIKQMKTVPNMLELGEIDISEEDAVKIAGLAGQIDNILNNINRNYTKLRFDAVKNFLRFYWGEDKVLSVGKNKNDRLTLDMILTMADRDINGLDRWVSSMSDASDPLLSLIDKVVRTSQSRRDSELNNMIAGIRSATKELLDAGYTSEFMYERDSNGNLTGRLISDINFIKFYEDREKYKQKLLEQKVPSYILRSKMEAWERRHMEKVKVSGSKRDRTEMLPAKVLYGVKDSDKLENKLSAAQSKYYYAMMQYKAKLDDLIPNRFASMYNAIQIRNDTVEGILDNISDPKKAAQMVWGNIKDKFLRRSDDVEFGDNMDGLTDSQKQTMLDFNGKPVEKLPIAYIHPLEDMQRLSTDFTSSIIAYAGMSVNYGKMSEIIDVLELARDLVHDREVQQVSGNTKAMESFKVIGKLFNKAYTKPGSNTHIGDRIDDYYASVIYGKQKKDEGTFEDTNIDKAKTADTLKSYTGAVGLGINLFSGISNLTIGKLQMFIEAMGGSLASMFGGKAEYFGLKNAAVGEKNYIAEMPQYLAEINSIQKKSKLGLLIDRFDALEEFYTGLKHNGSYKGPIARIMGKTNIFILNHLGEHSLHANTMLAMLDAYKVKDKTGNTISLYDAMEVKENNGVYTIGIKEGITKLDGTSVTEDDLNTLKMRIGKVNQSMHGAFNEIDRGAIHRNALGRLIMQFRQWMPAHYYRRFASTYYDATLDQQREGYYRTLRRFSWNTMKDLARMKLSIATNWNQLSTHEKNNITRALTDITTFWLLVLGVTLMGPEKDKKGNWYDRMVIYNLKRMKLESGASMPITPDFFKNIFTIVQSPAAAINSCNNILNVLEFWNMFNEIESGRYKGWSEWERDLIHILPLYGNVRKVFDISDEDYMFSLYNK